MYSTTRAGWAVASLCQGDDFGVMVTRCHLFPIINVLTQRNGRSITQAPEAPLSRAVQIDNFGLHLSVFIHRCQRVAHKSADAYKYRSAMLQADQIKRRCVPTEQLRAPREQS